MITFPAPLVRRLRRATVVVAGLVTPFLLLPRLLPLAPLRSAYPTSTAVYDRQGGLLRLTLADDERYRVWVPLERISPLLIEATLLQEDRHFDLHPGVDPAALLRGAWHTYIVGGRRMGGSTITMQLARLRYGINSATIGGKLVQIVRAVGLELGYTKREILEAYLNTVPYGGNIEGAAAASLIYFGKDPGALTLAEGLALAVVPQNPGRRAPAAARADSALTAARRALFERWRDAGLRLEEGEEAGLIGAELAITAPRDLPFRAPHFVDQVVAEGGGAAELHTSLDRRTQALVERQLRAFVASRARMGVRNAAAMLVDARTMEVRALVGSADFFDDRIAGQVNGTTAKRSPGSTLKPFIYALGIDQGVLHPRTILKDAPTSFGAYSPENFDGRFVGPLTAEEALNRSRNVPAVQVASRLSGPDLYGLLEMAGVSELRSRDHYGLALVLGGGDVTMEELLTLYGALANEGVARPIRYLRGEGPGPGARILSAEASYVTREMLRGNPRPDHLAGASVRTPPVAWKTGTSFGFHDAWTVGLFGPYLLAVWVGNFDGTPEPAFVGIQTAAPLFFRIVDAVAAQEPGLAEPIRPFPAGLSLVDVCAASGELPNADCPHIVPTLFVPGRSPIGVSTLHQGVLIDEATGLRACPPNSSGATRRVVYEMWDSEMLRLFQVAGLPRRSPPAYHPACTGHIEAGPGNAPPQITSPLRGVTYTFRADRVGEETITLRATAGAGVRELFWFAGESFLGRSEPGEGLSWRPTTPGKYLLRAVDDQGQSDTRQLDLSLVN